MEEKIELVDLSEEEMSEKLFPDRKVAVLSISKRVTNDGKTVHGWRVEFRELKNENGVNNSNHGSFLK